MRVGGIYKIVHDSERILVYKNKNLTINYKKDYIVLTKNNIFTILDVEEEKFFADNLQHCDFYYNYKIKILYNGDVYFLYKPKKHIENFFKDCFEFMEE